MLQSCIRIKKQQPCTTRMDRPHEMPSPCCKPSPSLPRNRAHALQICTKMPSWWNPTSGGDGDASATGINSGNSTISTLLLLCERWRAQCPMRRSVNPSGDQRWPWWLPEAPSSLLRMETMTLWAAALHVEFIPTVKREGGPANCLAFLVLEWNCRGAVHTWGPAFTVD